MITACGRCNDTAQKRINIFISLDAREKAMRQRIIDSVLSKYDTAKINGCFLIAANGQPFYCKCFGYENRMDSIPLHPHSIFQLASVTKPFTAVAILQLYEQGKLRLQDRVIDYLPEFPFPYITIENLLNHTAGLLDYLNDYYLFRRYFPKKEIFDNQDLLELLIRYKHIFKPLHAPGLIHRYSNTGYALLALIIEKVSKLSYEEYMRRYIFEPCQMTQSFVTRNIYQCNPQGIVRPYKSYVCNPKEHYDFLDGVVGDKGIYSTVFDVLKFDQALYQGKLLNDTTLQRAFTPTRLKNGNTVRYGLGWRLDYHKQLGNVVYHRGFWNSYNPALIRYIDKYYTVIILHNNTLDYSCSAIIKDFVEVISKNWVTEPTISEPTFSK
ncbi:MAG: serine hydrolase domain-containing protein [Bacteroidia bacterium]|nr:beta-lactamase family protein [Bacteroidia bacterium]MDW8159642.1 serine hydrolase domain-containing protein [Bacteroidia bacterium]